MKINFYKKQTVLNNILGNKNIIITNNSQLIKAIQKINNKDDNGNNQLGLNPYESEYTSLGLMEITYNYNTESNNYLTNLYKTYYNISPSISDSEIIENIQRYNNCEYSINIDESKQYINFGNSIVQNAKYNDYNKISQPNSLLLDSTYNSLYYIQHNRINLLSYNLNYCNGFNYNNHMAYFRTDDEYICSINNTLYYNFNKIRSTMKDNRGIGLIDTDFFHVKNYDSKNHASLLINKDFKYEVFMTLNKLKNLYKNCETIKNSLSYYSIIENYNNNYIHLKEENSNIIKNIRFQTTKLYYTDTSLGINFLEINDEDTLYINNIDNLNLQIGYISPNPDYNYEHFYINQDNMDLYKNTSSLIIDEININPKITYVSNYKYFSTNVVTNFIETSTSVWESKSHTTINQMVKPNILKFPINVSYYINMPSDIDKMIFKKSGLNIKYKGSPYLTYYDNTNPSIIIPQEHELKIRQLNSKVLDYSYPQRSCIKNSFKTKDSDISRKHYYLLSSKNLFYINNLQFIRCKRLLGDMKELTTNEQSDTKIYLKGTAFGGTIFDNNSGNTDLVQPCEIKINGGENLVLDPYNRGLNFVAIDKKSYEVIDQANYDTYGEAGGESERSNNGITLLKQKLNDIKNDITPYDTNDVFVCLVSYDAVGWDDELISLLQEFGMSDLPYTNTDRYPFLFIGYKNLDKGCGKTIMNDIDSTEVELTIYANNNTFGTIQIMSPNNIQITGLGNYNCYECGIYINKYLFDEFRSLNLISETPNLYYYQIVPLYIENYKNESIDNIYNQNKEYIPILNKYPTKYLNDKFFDSKMYSIDNYPIQEELSTCISDIKTLKTLYSATKLYLYEIYEDNDRYCLKFYTLLNNNSQDYISEIGNNISYQIDNQTKLLYNGKISNYLLNRGNLYQYLSQYLNNFIQF